MKVFGYHEDMDLGGWGASTELVEAWARSWKAGGFEPVLLGPKDALGHPLHDLFSRNPYYRGRLNPEPYERACFLRWLAIDNATLGMSEMFLAADTDCLCGIFGLHNLVHDRRGFLGDEASPWLMALDRQMVQDFLHWFEVCRRRGTQDSDGHVSDQQLLAMLAPAAGFDVAHCLARGVSRTDPKLHPLAVHFSNGECGRGGKMAAIKRLGLWPE